MGEVQQRVRAEAKGPPSAREVEVLALAGRGMSNREIAEALVVSDATVKRHLANTYEKLGVHSRSAAVDAALRSGLLHSEEVWGGRGTRYRCEEVGCGCQVVVTCPSSKRDARWRPPVCHGREMARVASLPPA